MVWLRLVRWPNLLIIGVVQCGLYFQFLFPHLRDFTLPFSTFYFLILVLVSCIVAASGNIINDIYDQRIDQYKNEAIIPKFISEKSAVSAYAGLVSLGAFLAALLSWESGYYISFIFYPLAVFGLWLYSAKLKCTVLLGNAFISLFMGGVILILVYAYWHPLVQLREVDVLLFEGLVERFAILTFFAVFSNLSREMVKDIEDVDADRYNHCESTAVKLGKQKVATLNVILSLVLSVVMALPFAFYLTTFWLSGIYVLLVLFPTISSMYLLYSGHSEAARKVSTGLKIYMIAGLIFLLLHPL